MTKEEIEREVSIYPSYCILIKRIETGLNTGINWYLENHTNLCQQNDFRPGTLGRYLACLLSIRFGLERTYDYIQQDNWDELFLKEYQPEFAKPEPYLGFFSGIDTMHRFYLFHSIYHQWGTTIRSIL